MPSIIDNIFKHPKLSPLLILSPNHKKKTVIAWNDLTPVNCILNSILYWLLKWSSTKLSGTSSKTNTAPFAWSKHKTIQVRQPKLLQKLVQPHRTMQSQILSPRQLPVRHSQRRKRSLLPLHENGRKSTSARSALGKSQTQQVLPNRTRRNRPAPHLLVPLHHP